MIFTLFGYGYWGKKLFPLLKKKGGVKVVDPALNQGLLANSKKIRSHQTFIATPEETHFELASQALNSDQHVYVEKPLSLTVKEAEKLLVLSQKQKKLVFVNYIFLYDHAVEIIKNLLEQRAIGKLQTIESTRFSVGTNKPNVSVTDDLAIHDLYLARYLSESPIKQVEVIKRKKKLGRAVEVQYQLQLENDVMYTGHLSWIQPEPARIMKLTGTEGQITWLKNSPHDQIHLTSNKLEQVIEVVQTSSPLETAISTFLEESKRPQLDFSAYPNYLEDTLWLEMLRALL